MLLTEHGQVYSWGGGSRGQLGHGTVTNEDSPRLVMALDGMKIVKIAAGGWHSAAISGLFVKILGQQAFDTEPSRIS